MSGWSFKNMPFSLTCACRTTSPLGSAISFGAKHKATPIRRPVRLPVMRRRVGHSDSVAFADRLHPYVEITAPVRTVGDQVSIRRPAWLAFETRVKGQLPNPARWRRPIGHGFLQKGEDNEAAYGDRNDKHRSR